MKPASGTWWCHYLSELRCVLVFSHVCTYICACVCFLCLGIRGMKWCAWVAPQFRWDDDMEVCTRGRLCFTVPMFPGCLNLWVIEKSPIRAWAHATHLLIPSAQLQEFPTYLWKSHPSAFTPLNPPAFIIPGKCTVTIEIKSEKHRNKTSIIRGNVEEENREQSRKQLWKYSNKALA